MPIEAPSTLDLALEAKTIRAQAKAELASCAIFLSTSIAIFIILAFLGEARELNAFTTLRAIFFSGTALLIALIAIAWKGWWHPSLRFINSGLQITILS